MSKKAVKVRKPRICFAEKLADKLRSSKIGLVEEGSFGDNSSRWVELRIGDKSMSISFDMKCENIHRIGVWKDIVQVVDTKQIF